MLNKVKKLYSKLVSPPKTTIVKEVTHNYELINKLSSIVYSSDFDSIFYQPTNKIYLLSVYTTSLNDLMNNITIRNINRSQSAISLYNYLLDSDTDLQRQFKRLLNILPSCKLSPMIEQDLNELCNTYEYLKELE